MRLSPSLIWAVNIKFNLHLFMIWLYLFPMPNSFCIILSSFLLSLLLLLCLQYKTSTYETAFLVAFSHKFLVFHFFYDISFYIWVHCLFATSFFLFVKSHSFISVSILSLFINRMYSYILLVVGSSLLWSQQNYSMLIYITRL